MGWFADLFARKRPSITDGPAHIVGAAHVLVVDGERVDDAADYISVVREIGAITDGALQLDRVTCVEGEPPSDDELDDDATLEVDTTRVMTLVRGDRTWTGRLRGHTDWIDSDRLLALLGDVLAELGARRRLHAIHHPTWGQELGVVYALESELAQLRAQGYTIEDDPEESHERDPEMLAAERMIHGHSFPAGTRVEYWRDPPYDEMEVTLETPHVVAGLALPAASSILFTEDGPILCCVIPVDHVADGRPFAAGTRIPFADGSWQLDDAETGY
jgi:hypothetical protein